MGCWLSGECGLSGEGMGRPDSFFFVVTNGANLGVRLSEKEKLERDRIKDSWIRWSI